MSSLEGLRDHVLGYDYSVAYAQGSQGRLELDFQLGVFWEIKSIYKSLLDAIKRTEEHALKEAKMAEPLSATGGGAPANNLTYQPGKVQLRPPQMNILGDFSEDLLGSYTEKWLNLAPEVTHRFVTAFLESGMDVCVSCRIGFAQRADHGTFPNRTVFFKFTKACYRHELRRLFTTHDT
jgi:hypothetical protein